MKTLSDRQRRILSFIHDFLEEKSYPPTVRDIARGCQISSTSVVDYNLSILQREGYIRRDPEVSRGMGLLDEHTDQPRMVKVPIIGQIAAGKPIPVPSSETWDNTASSETVEVTEEITQGKEGIYALRVKGDSMVDALIGDGDLILMQQANAADDGDMVAVWLKIEREATLKRPYRERERIRLQPANSQMKPIYADPDNVQVQGRVICVIRQMA